MSLQISASFLDQIREHGKRSYPNECCGLLIGTISNGIKVVEELKSMRNVREDSQTTRYLMDSAGIMEAEKQARQQGRDILGTYHSHPDHPARPSDFDRDHAFPWWSYIIVSVAKGEPADLTSWTLQEDRSAFDSEELIIGP